MKTIIAGSRSITNPIYVRRAAIDAGWPITEVVCGRARGVDTLGEQWAKRAGVPVVPFIAEWDRYGKSAGIMRNVAMANYADALIAIWDGKSTGTKHMIDIARRKGLKIFVYRRDKKSVDSERS